MPPHEVLYIIFLLPGAAVPNNAAPQFTEKYQTLHHVKVGIPRGIKSFFGVLATHQPCGEKQLPV